MGGEEEQEEEVHLRLFWEQLLLSAASSRGDPWWPNPASAPTLVGSLKINGSTSELEECQN